MGSYTIKFIIDRKVTRSWTTTLPPLVPREGEFIIGEATNYRVGGVAYEYLLPDGVNIFVQLERINDPSIQLNA